jgi:hypothetical protein
LSPALPSLAAQQAKAFWLAANKQVIRHRHIWQQVHFLIDRPDPQLLGMGGVFGEMALPSSQMVPRSAWYTPVRALISVDFPAPFSPVTP